MKNRVAAQYIEDITVFFLNDTPTTEIYTLSLHDALPILYEVLVLRRHNFSQICRDQEGRNTHMCLPTTNTEKHNLTHTHTHTHTCASMFIQSYRKKHTHTLVPPCSYNHTEKHTHIHRSISISM